MAVKSSKTLIIRLKLHPSTLAAFEPPSQSSKKSSARAKSTASNTSTSTPSNAVVEPSPDDVASDSNNLTPGPNSDAASTLQTPQNGAALPKRKGIPGPKPGSKRSLGATLDGQPKPRGKPGPKKKPRLDGDAPLAKGNLPGVTPTAAQKLGPRANQGAINAGLRALDRSGKPCRKWEKKGFTLKSFTGVRWGVPTWRAPTKVKVDENGDVKSDTTSISDTKPNQESSAVSEKSNGGADGLESNGVVHPPNDRHLCTGAFA